MAKKIVLTGISRGLGRALLEEFAASGHTVIGCARSGSAIWDLQQAYPGAHRFDVLDVNVDTDVQKWASSVVAEFGAPDLLINNAATINQNAPLWEVSHDEMKHVMSINVLAVASMIRYFMPVMMQQKKGVIVNLSSGWGRSVSPDVAPYCASKWAIEGMTRALAAELPAGMAAIPLNPGVINTDMLQGCFGADADNHQAADAWAKTAAPFILALDAKDNGQPLSAP